MRTRIVWAVTLIVLLTAGAALAVWLTNGNAVCTATGAQDYVAMAADGLGGAVMVWQDNRGASQNIFAQEIDGYGVNQWTANGVALCTNAAFQQSPRVIHNGFGYLHFAWQDYRNGNADIYIASTDRLGNIFTPADGLALCTATGDQSSPKMALYGPTGGIYAAWSDNRSGNSDIYLASFSQDNGIMTPANGSPLCTLPSAQEGPAVATRLLGYSVVAWSDFRNGNFDIYAQTTGIVGNTGWTANGIPVCTAAGAQLDAMIIDDGAYGVIIAWRDFRNGTFTQAIYAQRLNSAGVPLWGANGVLVAQSSDLIQLPRMISDGIGGAYIAWEDDRNVSTTGPDIYAQRLDEYGSTLWGVNGAVVCSAPYAQYGVEIARGEYGQPVFTWFDYRTLGPTEIYAQAMDGGVQMWATNGIPLCTATGNQFGPQIVYDGTGGCIAAWEDRRNGASNADIYAVRVHTYTGAIGTPEPRIISVIDVPNDNGGFVTVQWQPDNPATVSGYQIYRGTSPTLLWDQVANEVGNGSSTYNNVVATTGDGVTNYFMVFEFTTNFEEYNSNVKDGMSDSQATPIGDTPGMPSALALRPNSPNPFSASTQLHVGLPREADVQLEIYDVAGRRVFAREVGRMGAGWRDISFDGRDDRGQPLASGVYFYRVTAGRETTTRKMVIGR